MGGLMGLSRFERIKTDWDKVKASVLFTPYAKEFQFNDNEEWQCLELPYVDWSDIVPFPSLLNCTNNFDTLADHLNRARIAAGTVAFPATTRFTTGSYSTSLRHTQVTVYAHFPLKEMCQTLDLPYEVVWDESSVKIPPYSGIDPWCYMGKHTYEKEPGLMEYVRKEDSLVGALISVFGAHDAIQAGIKRCLHCGKRQYVKRAGIYPLGGDTKWKKTTQKEWERIKHLPKVHL
jgi:hypothetical protein